MFRATFFLLFIKGITLVFTCINICRVQRKLIVYETIRPSVQTSPEGPDKCKCNETTMCDRYSPALVNFHWARVRFGPVPLASCGNGSGVNSPTAVYFTVLSQTPRRPSYFQNSIIAWAMLIHVYFGYLIASKSEKAYKRPYHWARIPIKIWVLRIFYTDPKWKLYIVFKSIYFDDKLSFGVHFFGNRIFNSLTMYLEKNIGWKS